MADMQVEIGFNPESNEFTSTPTVKVPRGTERLHFVRDGKHPGWDFVGVAIWPESDPRRPTRPDPPPLPGGVCAPFNDPPPRLHLHGIVVVDTNPGQPGATYYSYQVWVVKPGSSQTYSNAPEIINKGG